MSLIKITNDLFDVAARLRTVNDGYRVYYNTEKARYEVRDEARRPNTLAFIVPYDELDCRTVEYAQYSQVANADRIFADVERSNAEVERQLDKQNLEKYMELYEQRRFYEGNRRC